MTQWTAVEEEQGSDLIDLRLTWREMENLIFGGFLEKFGGFLEKFGGFLEKLKGMFGNVEPS